jgi:hypothetical protein
MKLPFICNLSGFTYRAKNSIQASVDFMKIGIHWKLYPIQYFISSVFFRHLCRYEANPCCGKYGNLTHMRLRCFTVIVQYLVQGFLSSGDESYILLKFGPAQAGNIRTSFNASYSIYVRVQFVHVIFDKFSSNVFWILRSQWKCLIWFSDCFTLRDGTDESERGSTVVESADVPHFNSFWIGNDGLGGGSCWIPSKSFPEYMHHNLMT